jgi:hypothetical protein
MTNRMKRHIVLPVWWQRSMYISLKVFLLELCESTILIIKNIFTNYNSVHNFAGHTNIAADKFFDNARHERV